jgi:pSer/pThr/pTyr-binding forkhead associated (FHA) protein
MLAEARGARGFLQKGYSYALHDAQSGETHPVPSAEFIIGRSDAGIDIRDPEISRRHCEVRIMGDHLILIDLESTNGTHVRGEKVKTARLTPGQSFTIGNTTLEFRASRQQG